MESIHICVLDIGVRVTRSLEWAECFSKRKSNNSINATCITMNSDRYCFNRKMLFWLSWLWVFFSVCVFVCVCGGWHFFSSMHLVTPTGPISQPAQQKSVDFFQQSSIIYVASPFLVGSEEKKANCAHFTCRFMVFSYASSAIIKFVLLHWE